MSKPTTPPRDFSTVPVPLAVKSDLAYVQGCLQVELGRRVTQHEAVALIIAEAAKRRRGSRAQA